MITFCLIKSRWLIIAIYDYLPLIDVMQIIIFNSQFSIFNLVVSALAVFVDVEAFLLNALVNAQADSCVNHLI